MTRPNQSFRRQPASQPSTIASIQRRENLEEEAEEYDTVDSNCLFSSA